MAYEAGRCLTESELQDWADQTTLEESEIVAMYEHVDSCEGCRKKYQEKHDRYMNEQRNTHRAKVEQGSYKK